MADSHTDNGVIEQCQSQSVHPLYNQEGTCPICFVVARFAIQTNCGHLFCCACIADYWRHSTSVLHPVRCPVCRTEVYILMPMFDDRSRHDDDDNNDSVQGRRQANYVLNDYNRRFSDSFRPFWDHIRDLPILVPYMLRRLFSLEGLVWMFRMRVLVCMITLVIYVLSPIDVIPETIFGLFGIIDDIFVTFVLLLYATVAFRQVMADRNNV